MIGKWELSLWSPDTAAVVKVGSKWTLLYSSGVLCGLADILKGLTHSGSLGPIFSVLIVIWRLTTICMLMQGGLELHIHDFI